MSGGGGTSVAVAQQPTYEVRSPFHSELKYYLGKEPKFSPFHYCIYLTYLLSSLPRQNTQPLELEHGCPKPERPCPSRFARRWLHPSRTPTCRLVRLPLHRATQHPTPSLRLAARLAQSHLAL